jgi:putative flavoprotein involved in K+ transport
MNAPKSHDVLIIGAGQAGLAVSHGLSAAGVDHVILEQGRVANAWREDRWDSFCLVTPNWTISLPGAEYRGDDPDGFLDRDDYVAHLETWAAGFSAPVQEGVKVERLSGASGRFRVETDQGIFTARHVVVATATYQIPRRPSILDDLPQGFDNLVAARYRNPKALAPGGVLVIGSGQTGAQIAEELNLAGRDVYLSVGRSGRLPRRYRGRDCIEWQRDMGWLDRTPDMLADPVLRFRGDPHLSGGRGGHTISLHDLREKGVTPVGRLEARDGARLTFADDVADALGHADRYAVDFRAAVDDHIAARGLDAPAPTSAEMLGEPPEPALEAEPIRQLDLGARGISTVISAIGFAFDFSWIDFPVLDDHGYPITDRGRTPVPGLHFAGLNWMHKRKSGIIFGVAEDAEFLSRWIVETLAEPT